MSIPTLSWPQALAWRLERHGLLRIRNAGADEIAGRLCGVQAQVASSAELAIRVRSAAIGPADVGAAIADGRLIKTWAMRGTLHLFRASEAGTFLSLIAAARAWERPIWQRYFGLTPAAVERLRAAAREALAEGPLTREELIDRVTARDGLDHLGAALRSGWGTLLKPLAWNGDIIHGPMRGNRVTFQLPQQASPTWAPLPDPEVALPAAIRAYLAAYGPATPRAFGAWLSRGLLPQRRLAAAFAAPEAGLAKVEVEGETLYVRAEDVDELLATRPASAVRLLGGFDQWVLGPGTDDPRVIPPGRRAAVSRTAGWIAPIVVVGGVVHGTWQHAGGEVRVDWFEELPRPPAEPLTAEIERVSGLLAERDGAA